MAVVPNTYTAQPARTVPEYPILFSQGPPVEIFCRVMVLPQVASMKGQRFELSGLHHHGSSLISIRGPYIDTCLVDWLRTDFDRLRNRAGGRPNCRLKARLKEGSDS